MQSRKVMIPLLIVVLVTLSSIASAASFNKSTNPSAQAKDTLSGKYQGLAKSDQMGDIPITVEIKNDGGKLSGKIEGPQGAMPITGGTFADNKIVLKFDLNGTEGTVTAMLDSDKITGKWEAGGQGGAIDLKRAGAAPTPVTSTAGGASAAGDPISGEWDASAEVNGSSFPFTLKLKLDGDKVTGSSDSAQGSAPVSKGTWSGNKLSFSLDTGNGLIGMTAAIKDGKLVGDFDFAGQMTGKWEATKKK